MADSITDKNRDNGSNEKSAARTPELHKGHRERMRARFLNNGGNDFSDHELLEMLLFYSIPRADTNEIAHRLINEFGSLRAVCSASRESLERIDGIGTSSSILLNLLFTIRKRTDLSKFNLKTFKADRIENVGNFLIEYYKYRDCEEFCAMLLDNSLRLIEFVSLSTGSVNSASIDIRSLSRLALNKDSSYVIISHNHPGGTLNQSNEDKAITIHLQSALNTIGITLLDHIIVNDIAYAPTMLSQVSGRVPQADVEMINKFYWG